MSQSGQLSIDRDEASLAGEARDAHAPPEQIGAGVRDGAVLARPGAPQADERAARASLRAQIARLERELSGIVADGFPYISPAGISASAASAVAGPGVGAGARAGARVSQLAGPRVLSLEALELQRDRLAGELQDMRSIACERAEHERRAHELLERMKLEPGRYKFTRLPVSDLGQGGCGVWEVRPRFGLIGMLAGWWQVKLSSGCPLATGSRAARPVQRTAHQAATERADARRVRARREPRRATAASSARPS